MTSQWALRHSVPLAIALLVVASVALTLGFACALPLAAFAAISALLFERRAALVAVLSVWLVNQAVGFSCLHYARDLTTASWGLGLGALGLVALFAARAALGSARGVFAAPLAFLAAFLASEGLLLAIDAVLGGFPEMFTVAVIARIFAINAATFGVLLAFRGLVSRTSFGRAIAAALAPVHG